MHVREQTVLATGMWGSLGLIPWKMGSPSLGFCGRQRAEGSCSAGNVWTCPGWCPVPWGFCNVQQPPREYKSPTESSCTGCKKYSAAFFCSRFDSNVTSEGRRRSCFLLGMAWQSSVPCVPTELRHFSTTALLPSWPIPVLCLWWYFLGMLEDNACLNSLTAISVPYVFPQFPLWYLAIPKDQCQNML